MEEALATIERLLRQYGHVYRANLVDSARLQWANAPQAVAIRLNTAEWWSDKNAIAAVDLAIEGGFGAQARTDGQRLRRALIMVYEHMQACGQSSTEAEIVVSQFKKWLSSAI